MPNSIQDYRDCVWEIIIEQAEDFPVKKSKFEEKSRISFFQYCILNVYIHLILLRMFLIQNPFLYFLCYFFVYFFLLITKNYFFIYLICLIILISKLCFFLTCDTVNEYRGCMSYFSNIDLPYEIKTTRKNAIIFSYCNLSLLYEPNYNIFLLRNKLDMGFIEILIQDHFILNNLPKENLELDIKK